MVTSEVQHHASKLSGLGVTLSRAFESGLTVSANPAIEKRRHAARDPLFGKKREDRKLSLTTRVLHNDLRYRGFTPYVGVSFERNRSNISIYTYDNHGAVFGLSRTF